MRTTQNTSTHIQRLVARHRLRIVRHIAVDGLRSGRLHVVDLERHVRILAVAHELEPACRTAARGAPVAAHQIEGQLTGGRHGHLGAGRECGVHVGGVDVLVDAGDVGLAGCERE